MLGDRVQLQRITLNLIVDGIEAMSGVTDRPRDLLIRSGQYGPDQRSSPWKLLPSEILGSVQPRRLYFYVCNDFSVVTYFRPVIGSAIFILPVPNLPKLELAFAVSAG